MEGEFGRDGVLGVREVWSSAVAWKECLGSFLRIVADWPVNVHAFAEQGNPVGPLFLAGVLQRAHSSLVLDQ